MQIYLHKIYISQDIWSLGDITQIDASDGWIDRRGIAIPGVQRAL